MANTQIYRCKHSPITLFSSYFPENINFTKNSLLAILSTLQPFQPSSTFFNLFQP